MPHSNDPLIERILQQHAAFWRRESTVPPLLAPGQLARHSRLGAFYHPDLPRSGAFTPEMIRVDEMASRFRRWLERDGIVDGPLLQVAEISHTVPWLEAILGCAIQYSFDQDTMWTEPPRDQAGPLEMPDLSRSVWMSKLVELTGAFAEMCKSGWPIGTLQLRGVTDLLGVWMHPSRLALMACDDPAALHSAVAICAELCVQVVKQYFKCARPFHGGYVNYFQVWAPGSTVVWSQDLSTIFSPKMYREFFLPFDVTVASSIDYPVLHIHTSELHALPFWTEIPGLTLEITVDPTGTTIETALPLISRALERVPLMLQVQNEKEYQFALSNLKPQGLHLVSRYPRGRSSVENDERFN